MSDEARGHESGALIAAAGEAAAALTGRIHQVHKAILGHSTAWMGPVQGAGNLLHSAIAATAYTSVSVGFRASGKLGSEALHQVAQRRSWQPWGASENGAFLIGALNGFAGDRLDRRRSGLSHEPQVWRDGRRAMITSPGLRRAFPHASGHLVVFFHGLSETEQSWKWTLAGRNQNALTACEGSGTERFTNGTTTPGSGQPAGSRAEACKSVPPGSQDRDLNNRAVTYGDLLQSDHGCTPIYFRYNTGRHIASNGADISSTLDDIVDNWPVPVERIDLIGHSMGGLVTRATLAAGRTGSARWLTRFGHAVYLGTPHTGSPVARFAHKAGKFLEIVPVLAPFSDLATHTSDGIADLRHGDVVQRSGHNRTGRRVTSRSKSPGTAEVPTDDGGVLADDVATQRKRHLPGMADEGRHHVVVAFLGQTDRSLTAKAIGDLLVLPVSAAAHDPNAGLPTLAKDDVMLLPNSTHFHLLNDRGIYERIVDWLDLRAGQAMSLTNERRPKRVTRSPRVSNPLHRLPI